MWSSSQKSYIKINVDVVHHVHIVLNDFVDALCQLSSIHFLKYRRKSEGIKYKQQNFNMFIQATHDVVGLDVNCASPGTQ